MAGLSGDDALNLARAYVKKTLQGAGALKGEKGEPGEGGFSPKITENADNTDEVYKLDIETKDGTFTTPNLKGEGGNGSETYIVNCQVTSETDGNVEVHSYDGDFAKIKQTIANGGKVELRTNFNGSNYILEPSRVEENYVSFNTVDKKSILQFKLQNME